MFEGVKLIGPYREYDVHIHVVSPVTGQPGELRLSMPADSPWEVLRRLALVHNTEPKRQLSDIIYDNESRTWIRQVLIAD